MSLLRDKYPEVSAEKQSGGERKFNVFRRPAKMVLKMVKEGSSEYLLSKRKTIAKIFTSIL